MAYLVDTDILVDLLRRNKGAADYLDAIGDWSLSIITGMELIAGAKNKDEIREIDIVVATYEAIPLNSDIGELAYNLMKTYAKSHGLDPTDAIIAATAIHEGLKLSTKNKKHFASIKGLEMDAPDY